MVVVGLEVVGLDQQVEEFVHQIKLKFAEGGGMWCTVLLFCEMSICDKFKMIEL